MEMRTDDVSDAFQCYANRRRVEIIKQSLTKIYTRVKHTARWRTRFSMFLVKQRPRANSFKFCQSIRVCSTIVHAWASKRGKCPTVRSSRKISKGYSFFRKISSPITEFNIRAVVIESSTACRSDNCVDQTCQRRYINLTSFCTGASQTNVGQHLRFQYTGTVRVVPSCPPEGPLIPKWPFHRLRDPMKRVSRPTTRNDRFFFLSFFLSRV